MSLIIARFSLPVLFVMLAQVSVVSLKGQSLQFRNVSTESHNDCLDKPGKRRWSDRQTPMPSATYFCEFGVGDLLCGNCVGGTLINQPLLCYPRVARAARIKGFVQMRMVVDQRGKVVWTRVLNKVHYLLQAAATQEALQRKYKPFVCNGHPVKAVIYQNYKFE
jgi:hypothetical protein